MSRFDFSRPAPRLALLSVGATLPFLALILWLVAGGIDAIITSTEGELKGDAFQRPLEHLLAVIPRRLVAVQSHGSDIGALDLEIDQALVDLDAVSDRFGVDLQFTAEALESRNCSHLRVALLRDRWRTLTAATPVPAGYNRILTDIRSLIAYTGNSATLAVDPDLDSAALIDVTLRALPEMLLRLNALMQAAVPGVPTAGADASAGRNSPAVNLAALDERRVQVDRDLEVMLNEDGNFYGIHVPLHVAVKEEWKQVAQAVDALTRLPEQENLSGAEERLRRAVSAETVCHHFWVTAVDQLDQLLEKRIRAQQAMRANRYGLMGLLVLVVGWAGWALGRRWERANERNGGLEGASFEPSQNGMGERGSWLARSRDRRSSETV